jgi:hypothetical protein
MTRSIARTTRIAAGMIAALAMVGPSFAAEPVHLTLETHAAFFSRETKQAKPVDPQVFVADAAVPAGVGPQGIKHVAGFRPALIQADPATSPLFNAEGARLGFTLGEWLRATGTVTMTAAANGAETVVVDAKGLRPNAVYSLFENHFDQTPVGFTPLDGTGRANSFHTDAAGHGHASLTAPQALTSANAVLLILDDDGQTHGMTRGAIGVSAQHHLIAQPAK